MENGPESAPPVVLNASPRCRKRFRWILLVVFLAGIACVVVVFAPKERPGVIVGADDTAVICSRPSKYFRIDFYGNPFKNEVAPQDTGECGLRSGDEHAEVYIEDIGFIDKDGKSAEILCIEDPSAAQKSDDDWRGAALGPEGVRLSKAGYQIVAHQQGHWDIGSKSDIACLFHTCWLGGRMIELRANPPFEVAAVGHDSVLKSGSTEAWKSGVMSQ